METTHKHGGYKWQATHNPNGCEAFGGFDFATLCVTDAAIEYHAFGDYAMEMPARFHSAIAFLKICDPAHPTDCGEAFISQLVDFGQCVSPYQGAVIPCPLNPNPTFPADRAPYAATDCIGAAPCRVSRQFVFDHDANVNGIWTTDPDNVTASHLLIFLYRVRDAYQLYVKDTNPIVFAWMCSNDGGVNYTAIAGCRYNNSTTFVQEIGGEIPSAWDTLDGVADGHVTYSGYTTDFGDIAPACTAPGAGCHPLKLISVPVGKYGGHMIDDKDNQFLPVSQPERAICFTAAFVLTACDTPGAIEAPWVGSEN